MFCNKGRSSAQGKSSWRPLHKPQWYTVFKQTRNNILTAMDLFPGKLLLRLKKFIFGVKVVVVAAATTATNFDVNAVAVCS